MNWSYLNIQTFLIAIIAALDAQTLLVLCFWPPFEYTHFMSLNICIIPIIPLSSPASLVMVGSWLTQMCCVDCFALELASWIDFKFFFQSYLIVNTWLQSNRTLRTKSRRLLTRDAQIDTTGILILLCALLEWGLSVTSATCVSHVWRAPMAPTAKQEAALPGLEVLLIPWVSAQGLPNCYCEKAVVCERLNI